MTAYLLTWNPKRWHWWDDLGDSFEKSGKYYLGNWSCASKRVQVNDRVFLIRLGKEPRGIVASGWADSTPYYDTHWDDDLAALGKSALYVDVRFDVLLNPSIEKIFSRKDLDRGILGRMHWNSQLSGIHIPDDVVFRLEEEWGEFLRLGRHPVPSADSSAMEGLRTETVTYIKGRSRYLRDLALEESQGICSVCDVDYSNLLGGKGVRVLQVHHRKQLAADDAPRLTHLSDLAVVCANCHMLIHMNPKNALDIDELRGMLNK
jgi:5-methylcytosine-specific restriction enzyme A